MPIHGVVYPLTLAREGVAELFRIVKKISEHGDANNAILQVFAKHHTTPARGSLTTP